MDTIIELTPHAVLVGDRMHMLPSLIGVDSQRDAHSVLVITGADPSWRISDKPPAAKQVI